MPAQGPRTMAERRPPRSGGMGLRRLWNQREVTVVLSGMSALSQLTENLAVAETPFRAA
ncbi:MAG: hypothetical protein LBQ67_07800 [Treponema sp.]|jgi:predicted aldo/keto reductase-like oxidoreductase|nr:hypothetical protein [Treponema sp.]